MSLVAALALTVFLLTVGVGVVIYLGVLVLGLTGAAVDALCAWRDRRMTIEDAMLIAHLHITRMERELGIIDPLETSISD